jgi:enterochelin esterase-like enzyme
MSHEVSTLIRRLHPLVLFLLGSLTLTAQQNPIQEIVEAARVDSPTLESLLGKGLPELKGRDGAIVWGQEFFFAVESPTPATVSIDKQPPLPMKRVAGTNFWYLLKTLRMGTTHQYQYADAASGKIIGTYEVASYNPDSYPMLGVPRGKLSERKTLTSTIYPNMTVNGAPLMVWQDGESIVGNQDLARLRLQIVSDNLVARGSIPPMVHVLIQPGQGGPRMRSVQYDTVSGTYGKYLLEEILPDVEKTYKLRKDAYSRASAGASSGAICAFNVAWYYPGQFSRVLSHIGSYTALQWKPEEHLEGGYVVSYKVGREERKNIRVWLSAGADDNESRAGSWPLNNIQLANTLKLRGYDFHFRFGGSMHAIAQGAMDLPESLTWLWRDYDPAKTSQTYEMEEAERKKPVFRVTISNRDAW